MNKVQIITKFAGELLGVLSVMELLNPKMGKEGLERVACALAAGINRYKECEEAEKKQETALSTN